jgi:hypothetical protein
LHVSSEITGSRRPGPRSWRWIALVAVAAILVSVGGTVLVLYATGAFSTEIEAEPVQRGGADPFMPPVGPDHPAVVPPPKVGGPTFGDTAGLYGGTLNESSCDRQKMITFLQANPDKATAWASVEGIDVSALPAYITSLTPLLLRSDTAVTNHGFADGRATTRNSVLQAGSAVLVDTHGVPRSRCSCGNPLTPSKRYSHPSYGGPVWPTFSQINITIVENSVTVINQFTIINVVNNQIIYRPAGTQGDRDTTQPPEPSPPPSSEPPPSPPTSASPPTRPDLAGSYSISKRLESCSGLNAEGDSCPDQDKTVSDKATVVDCGSTQTCTMVFGSGLSVDLTSNGNGVWQGTGELAPDKAFTCFGQPRPTSFEVTLTISSTTGFQYSETDSAPEESSECPAARKTYSGSGQRT